MIGKWFADIINTILNVRGGATTLQDLTDEWSAVFDVARSPQSGTYTFADADEETLYEESDDHPFPFLGGYIDWTGANSGATIVPDGLSMILRTSWASTASGKITVCITSVATFDSGDRFSTSSEVLMANQ